MSLRGTSLFPAMLPDPFEKLYWWYAGVQEQRRWKNINPNSVMATTAGSANGLFIAGN